MTHYLPLARSLARRFFHTAAERDDLTQVANYALVKAVDRFDCRRGVPFPAFASPTITGELKRYLRDYGFTIRVPRTLHERALIVERIADTLSALLGRSPTAAEIAADLRLSVEQVLEAVEVAASRRPISFDESGRDDEDTLTERAGADDPNYERVDGLLSIAAPIRDLPKREREILRLRFGEDLSQSQIAARLGLSQMHISRLIRNSIDNLWTMCAPERREPSSAGTPPVRPPRGGYTRDRRPEGLTRRQGMARCS